MYVHKIYQYQYRLLRRRAVAAQAQDRARLAWRDATYRATLEADATPAHRTAADLAALAVRKHNGMPSWLQSIILNPDADDNLLAAVLTVAVQFYGGDWVWFNQSFITAADDGAASCNDAIATSLSAAPATWQALMVWVGKRRREADYAYDNQEAPFGYPDSDEDFMWFAKEALYA
jgi:hypothetical protein